MSGKNNFKIEAGDVIESFLQVAHSQGLGVAGSGMFVCSGEEGMEEYLYCSSWGKNKSRQTNYQG